MKFFNLALSAILLLFLAFILPQVAAETIKGDNGRKS